MDGASWRICGELSQGANLQSYSCSMKRGYPPVSLIQRYLCLQITRNIQGTTPNLLLRGFPLQSPGQMNARPGRISQFMPPSE
jgi:hypothetical protein